MVCHMPDLVPELENSEQFLKQFTEDTIITFQTFSDLKDSKDSKDKGSKPRIIHDKFANVASALSKLNKHGDGVFFMVNRGDLRGRAAANVNAIRALFVDLDGAPVQQLYQCKLEPHFIIESSPGRFHGYWLVEDCPLTLFTPLQKALAKRFGGDPSVHDLPRVMRLPGFLHNKGEPFVTRVVANNCAQPYKTQTVINALDLSKYKDQEPPKPVDRGEILSGVTEGNRDNQLFKLICSYHEKGLTKEEMTPLVITAARNCKPPFPEKEALAKIDAVEKRYEKGTPKKKKGKQVDVAFRSDYVALFHQYLSRVARDIFSTDLLCWDDHEIGWIPAINLIDYLRAKAKVIEETGGARFDMARIKYHLTEYEKELEPKLLVDIPEWDGIDRFEDLSKRVTLSPEQQERGMTDAYFCDLLKDWYARAFDRLRNPMIQNRIFVLKGDQGVGKDTLVDTLVGGLEQFAVNMTIHHSDSKDTYMQLHAGLVVKIAEFDRTARTEVSVLKDLITTPDTFIRAPYDKSAKRRKCRCSFIATANVPDLLKDYTGNRRYIILEIEKIDWGYEQSPEYKKQILAQARHLSEINFHAAEVVEQAMRDYIADQTPISPNENIADTFLYTLEEHLGFDVQKGIDVRQRGWITVKEAEPVLNLTCKITQQNKQKIQSALTIVCIR